MSSLGEIYNLLFEGKTLQLEFDSLEEAEKFRISLAQVKMVKDRQMVDVGLLEREELQKLSFRVEAQSGTLPLDSLIPEDEPKYIATIAFKEKKLARQFKILKVIDPDDDSGSD